MKHRILLALLATLLFSAAFSYMNPVSAQPIPVDFTSTGICVGSPTQFTSTVPNPAIITNYNWNFGDGNFSNLPNPSHTFGGTFTYTVTLTVTDTGGNTGTVTHFVGIHPLPVANFSFATPNCHNDPIQFTDLSNTVFGYITTWIWNFGDGSPNDTVRFPDNPNVTHTFPTFGTFAVTLTVINSENCSNSRQIAVTVLPSPIANFYYNTSGLCEDQVIQFTDASFPNGAGNIVAWNWNFGDPTSGINNNSNLTNPTHTFNTQGTYTVILTVTNFNNCTDTMTKQVVINDHPPVDFTWTTACLNQLVHFNPDPAATNIGAISTWWWDFGDGNNSSFQNTAHAYTSPGTYTVSLTVTDTLGCDSTVFHNITVNPLPVAHFSAGNNNCSGATVQFNDQSSYTAGYITHWIWNYGDGNIDTVNHPGNPNVTHVYALPGTYNVTLTILSSDGCTNFETQAVIIQPNPIANFYFPLITCEGSPVQFTDISQTNGGGSIIQWNWNFGDPLSGAANNSALPSPTHSFTGPGSYSVTLIVETSNGCIDTVSYNVNIHAKPPVDFTSQNNCQNNQVLFSVNTSVVNVGAIVIFAWAFGDGGTATGQNPVHVYNLSGTYFVTLTITDTAGCSNTITKPVTIEQQPVSNFTYTQPACKDSQVTFTSLHYAPVGYIVTWVWDFGDGSTVTINYPNSPNLTHTYTNYGTFPVTLTITSNNGCTAFITQNVTVSANPLANFSYNTHCLGSSVQFTDLSQAGSGGVSSWSWDFGDPGSGAGNTSSLQNPTHVYNAAGTYNVTLNVTNTGGCTATIAKQVVIYAKPTVNFSITPGCANDSTHFISSTYVNLAAIVSWQWNFGDGYSSNQQDPYHIYANAGSYTVLLTVTDTAGCQNSITHVAVVTLPPTAFFQVSAQNCSGLPVTFTDMSTVSSGTIVSWHWEFGDGSDTLIQAPANPNVSHIYTTAGNYTVLLTVNSSLGCEGSYPRTITIQASPLAAFAFGNTCSGASVSFTNQSTTNGGSAIVSYLWNFGDPASGTSNTSILQNPLHVFNSPGNYIVNLLITNANGCTDTVMHTVIVHPSPSLEYSWTNTCLGNSTQFTVDGTVTNIAAVAAYDWDFGDGTPHGTVQNPVHTYTQANVYSVVLTITDTAGCMNSKVHAVTISSQPVAMFAYSSGCINTATQFTDQSYTLNGEPIAIWHWDFGETTMSNDTANIPNPQWTFSAQGIYTVSLTVTTASGCQNSTSTTLQVFGAPTANYTYIAAPCENGAVYFQDSSFAYQANITSWLWEFDPAHYSNLQNPVYVFYASDSCYNVKLIVTDNRGCMDTIVKSVCVPAPYDFTFNNSATCLEDSMDFTPMLVSPLTDSLVFFSWNFGDPASGIYNTSALRNPSHLYSSAGVYTVSLQATDIHNCTSTRFRQVTVNPLPIADFAFTVGNCDSIVSFSDLSNGNGSAIIKWIWNYGDGTVDTVNAPASPNVSHKYLNPSLFTVQLTVINANNCSEDYSQDVLARPCIDALFSTLDPIICQNYNTAFADNSYSGLPITKWFWDFGDGTTSSYTAYQSPVYHSYANSGNYTVKMRITTSVSGQSISDSSQINIIVSPSPIADFSTGKVCFGSAAQFTNQTVNNGVLISGYKWDFNDPASANDTSTMRSPSWTFAAPGYYDVRLISLNSLGCTDTVIKTVPVYMLPEAKFDYSLSCSGNRTLFFDHSDSAYAPLSSWTWRYIEGNQLLDGSMLRNPEYVFQNSGDHLVILTVQDTNSCSDTASRIISTWPSPVSAFSFNENYDNVQGQLLFQNSSTGATHYYWDFGNGASSFADNPQTRYDIDGTYPISLIAYSDKECSDTSQVIYKFMVKGLFIPNAFSPENPHTEVQLFKPVGINLKEYLIQVYDRFGNLLWYSSKLDDQGRPVEGWNGRYNGVLLPEGVYVWKAEAVFKDGVIWNSHDVGSYENLKNTTKGTVTLIR